MPGLLRTELLKAGVGRHLKKEWAAGGRHTRAEAPTQSGPGPRPRPRTGDRTGAGFTGVRAVPSPQA
ncbi:hypothetical protein H8959_019210 [Pygathrix nigripes]